MVTPARRPAWATISASCACTRVQHDVLDAALLEHAHRRSDFGSRRADQRRTAFVLARDDVLDDRVPLLAFGPVDEIGLLGAPHRPVRRDDDDVEVVDLGASAASVSAVPVMPDSFLYLRKKFWKVRVWFSRSILTPSPPPGEPVAPAASGHQAALNSSTMTTCPSLIMLDVEV